MSDNPVQPVAADYKVARYISLVLTGLIVCMLLLSHGGSRVPTTAELNEINFVKYASIMVMIICVADGLHFVIDKLIELVKFFVTLSFTPMCVLFGMYMILTLSTSAERVPASVLSNVLAPMLGNVTAVSKTYFGYF